MAHGANECAWLDERQTLDKTNAVVPALNAACVSIRSDIGRKGAFRLLSCCSLLVSAVASCTLAAAAFDAFAFHALAASAGFVLDMGNIHDVLLDTAGCR